MRTKFPPGIDRGNLVYEDTPRYDLWLKLILGGVLTLTFILGIVIFPEDVECALAMFGITIFDAILFKAILPRRFQIFQDRLRIALGKPLAVNIPLTKSQEARLASGRKAFAYGGLRLATSSRYLVEIVRKKGLNLVISPSSGDAFLEQLNQALKAASNPN